MSSNTAILPSRVPRFSAGARLLPKFGRDRLLGWRRRRKIISELNQYSPRELNELGISKADIERIAASAELQ
jgi:uncharacterized protein YjiS (DUF1127 family)